MNHGSAKAESRTRNQSQTATDGVLVGHGNRNRVPTAGWQDVDPQTIAELRDGSSINVNLFTPGYLDIKQLSF